MDVCKCFAGSDEPNPNCPIHGSYPLNRDPQTGRFKPPIKPTIRWETIPVLHVTVNSLYELERSPWFIPVEQYGRSSNVLPGECGAIECPPDGTAPIWEFDRGVWIRNAYPSFRLVVVVPKNVSESLEQVAKEMEESGRELEGWLRDNINPVGINLYAHAHRLLEISRMLRNLPHNAYDWRQP